MVPSQLNSRLGFVNPGLTLNTMIPWYHTMVFVHIHIYTQVYRSLQYDTCHHTYIYMIIYTHIILQTITKLNKRRVLSFAPKSWIRTNQDLLRSVDRRPLHTCNIMLCNHCIQSSKAVLVPMPWTHSGGEHQRSLKIQMAPTYTRSIDFSQQMMFPLGH